MEQRKPWLILFSFSIVSFFFGIFLQHKLDLMPCALCISQRLAILGIGMAALLVVVYPKCAFLRCIGLLGWGCCAFYGLSLAWNQLQYYIHPEILVPCPSRVNFPQWLLLDIWVPSWFKVYTGCEPMDFSLLGLNIPQLSLLGFSAFCLVFVVACFNGIVSNVKHISN